MATVTTEPAPCAADAAALKDAAKNPAGENASTLTTKQCKQDVAIIITVARKSTAATDATLGDLDVRRVGDKSAAVTGATLEQPAGTRNIGHGSKTYPIPAGTYNAHIKNGSTKNGNVTGHRNQVIELESVDRFNYIFMHVGNTSTDTDGCILLGGSSVLTPVKDKKTKKVLSQKGSITASVAKNKEVLDFVDLVKTENEGKDPKITVIISNSK